MRLPWSTDHRRTALPSRFDLPTRRAGWWFRFRPEQVLLASFVSLIVVGTLGLRFIPGLYAPGAAPLGWIDAAFTMTSAVCVTGLTLVDTATYFSFWGQLWLLIFIQLGGLGIITISSLVILALGGRLSLRSELLSAGSISVAPRLNRAGLVRDVVLFTLLIELIGFLVLWALWEPHDESGDAWWHALFHSISAFCNAGFSTFSTNLIQHQHSTATLLTIGSLVVLGGLGFLAMEELYIRSRRRREGETTFRVSLHSRIVLTTTAVLILLGWGAFLWLERDLTFAHMTLTDKLSNAWFMSVTARTAGFNSVDYAQTSAGANFLTIILMSIGGSPGSTAGGLKTTTIALVVLLAWSRFRRRAVVNLWGRTVPDETIGRAVGLIVFAFAVMTAGMLLLTITENHGAAGTTGEHAKFFGLLFEVVSAFNTVGLTMGQTYELSPFGRGVTIVLMLLGRVGLLTFAAAFVLSSESTARKFRYASEDIVVG